MKKLKLKPQCNDAQIEDKKLATMEKRRKKMEERNQQAPSSAHREEASTSAPPPTVVKPTRVPKLLVRKRTSTSTSAPPLQPAHVHPSLVQPSLVQPQISGLAQRELEILRTKQFNQAQAQPPASGFENEIYVWPVSRPGQHEPDRSRRFCKNRVNFFFEL